jgi:hypothetical protein
MRTESVTESAVDVENYPLSELNGESVGQLEIQLRVEFASHPQDESGCDFGNDWWSHLPNADPVRVPISVRCSELRSCAKAALGGDSRRAEVRDVGGDVRVQAANEEQRDACRGA